MIKSLFFFSIMNHVYIARWVFMLPPEMSTDSHCLFLRFQVAVVNFNTKLTIGVFNFIDCIEHAQLRAIIERRLTFHFLTS